MRRTRTRLGAALLVAGFIAGVSQLTAQSSIPPRAHSPSLDAAIRSDGGQAWADALVSLARRTSTTSTELAVVTRALDDTSAIVRRRGAQAVGALGPLARAAIPQLIALLSDTVSSTGAEAAFAIGVVRDRSEPVLEALFRAAVAHGGIQSASALFAITALGRYPLVPVSPAFSEELRAALRSPTIAIRRVGLRTAMLTDVQWAADEYERLLADPNPGLRIDAAYAVAGLGPEGRAAEGALRRLSSDSVSWVREEVPPLLARLGSARPKSSPVDACMHRATRRAAAVSGISVLDPLGSLRDDQRGAYVGGATPMVVAQETAFNFLLAHAPRDPGPAPDRPDVGPDASARFLEIDLTRPVPKSGAAPIGTVKDAAARFHAFFMRDVHGTVWNLRDIPIGASIRSDRTQLNFFVHGRYHLLQFGPWALGDCSEGYANGARFHGAGTTPVIIHRLSDHEFRFTAPRGSTARLWEWPRGESPVDRGLYYFSFDMRLFPADR